jgi:hypothetical protein
MSINEYEDDEWDDYESWEDRTEDEDFPTPTQYSVLDWEWNKIIGKLQNGRLRLTTQEENIIAQIANRL